MGTGLPPGVTGEQVGELLATLRLIPDGARAFTVSTQDARRYYSLTTGLLDFVVELGLPHAGAGEDAHFDLVDVMNLALHLGFSPAARAARRFWAAGLNRPPGGEPARYEVEYRAACPIPGHPPPCRYRVILSDDRAVDRQSFPEDDEPLAVARAALVDDWPELPPAARDLLDEVGDLQFVRLPPALRRDIGFIRRTGLSDCAGTATLLRAEGLRRGLRVRSSYGFIIVPPFSTTHHWAEIWIDGRWIPVDPVLIRAMIGWGVLDGAAWHPYRSPGAIFSRVCESGSDLVTHEGTDRGVMLTLPTRRIAAD